MFSSSSFTLSLHTLSEDELKPKLVTISQYLGVSLWRLVAAKVNLLKTEVSSQILLASCSMVTNLHMHIHTGANFEVMHRC